MFAVYEAPYVRLHAEAGAEPPLHEQTRSARAGLSGFPYEKL